MEKPSVEHEKKETFRSWAIVVAIAVSFFCWGLLIFFTVGDKGQPSWDFNIVEDIPGQSAFSTFRAKQSFGDRVPLVGQHVAGVTHEPQEEIRKGE